MNTRILWSDEQFKTAQIKMCYSFEIHTKQSNVVNVVTIKEPVPKKDLFNNSPYFLITSKKHLKSYQYITNFSLEYDKRSVYLQHIRANYTYSMKTVLEYSHWKEKYKSNIQYTFCNSKNVHYVFINEIRYHSLYFQTFRFCALCAIDVKSVSIISKKISNTNCFNDTTGCALHGLLGTFSPHHRVLPIT